MSSPDDYPHPSSAAATAVMRGNRRRDTRPERLVRSRLHALGLRYRVDYRIDVGAHRVRADVAFTGLQIAVFVDGCFWHGCPEHGNRPRVNTAYWGPKLRRNFERDQRNTRELEAAGWTVLRIWEHEEPDAAAMRVSESVRQLASERSATSLESPRPKQPATCAPNCTPHPRQPAHPSATTVRDRPTDH
ncbi:MAG: very short patch repair endonuclease [Acidimicrobiia bacterium]